MARGKVSAAVLMMAAVMVLLSACNSSGKEGQSCPLLDGAERDVKLSNFQVGPIDLLIRPPDGSTKDRKLWWSPVSGKKAGDSIAVRVEGDNYHRSYVFALSGDESNMIYPGAVEFPSPGEYSITGTSGGLSDCFRIAAR